MENKVIAVVGLGYVGLPVAVEFGKKLRVIGFDIAAARIDELKRGKDSTGEVSSDDLGKSKNLTFTSNDSDLRQADVVIVCVPTPVDGTNKPDFTPLLKASATVGKNLKAGAIVVYESTVYPGATEDICVPELERVSGKKWKQDFFVGYSPERINPGDKKHTLTTIKKVVSGDTASTSDSLKKLYGSIITAGIHEASSIKVAEAAKIIENTQRDINIALINECSMIFHKLGIDTSEVLDAASTKWNFLNFRPGLVGGHCIGVDPYYLTEKAMMLGHHPEVILSGRRTNDGMGKYVAQQAVKHLIQAGTTVKGAKANILGLAFKENVPDLRNTKVVDVIAELKEFGIDCHVCDPVVSEEDAHHEYGTNLIKFSDLPVADLTILAVPHENFLSMGESKLCEKTKKGGVFVDLKAALSKHRLLDSQLHVWRL